MTSGRTALLLVAEAVIFSICAVVSAIVPFSYDPDGMALSPNAIDIANDGNFLILKGVVGESVASAFILLRTLILSVFVVSTILNIRFVYKIFIFLSGDHTKIALSVLAAISCVVFVPSTFLQLFIDKDALSVAKDATFFGNVRDGLWWITYPIFGWSMSVAVPILIASITSIAVNLARRG